MKNKATHDEYERVQPKKPIPAVIRENILELLITAAKLLPTSDIAELVTIALENPTCTRDHRNIVVCRAFDCVHHDFPVLGFQCGKCRTFISNDGKCENFAMRNSKIGTRDKNKEG